MYYGIPVVRYCGQMLSCRGSALVLSDKALSVVTRSTSAAVWLQFSMECFKL